MIAGLLRGNDKLNVIGNKGYATCVSWRLRRQGVKMVRLWLEMSKTLCIVSTQECKITIFSFG